MARKQPSDTFLEYEESIVANPVYSGMPDVRYSDGSIQWEAPSNRTSGEFRFTHDRRQKWWEDKAEEIGISTDEAHWISKVAKRIHPTKRKPCKTCGRVMDIRYCYLSANFIKAVRKLPFVDARLEMDDCTHIFDFVADYEALYGAEALEELRGALRCKAVPDIPHFAALEPLLKWLDDVYIPAEPSKLGPGAMSNAPDRLDGFHTYNRCCRSKEDKGRTKQNLASYSTDRRAFEYWVDGNWVQANKAMGLFRTDSLVSGLTCLNAEDGGVHPSPCDADHIGPISLGFMHRPVFQPLCSACNSAKNNRMYYADVRKLIAAEDEGQDVVTWYARAIWNALKGRVATSDDAIKLSRLMRDNRHNAMLLLGRLLAQGHYLYLATLLNLDCADYVYSDARPKVANDGTVTVEFSSNVSELKYKQVQKYRRLRVGFQALRDYNAKENRNWYPVDLAENQPILASLDTLIDVFEASEEGLNERLGEYYSADFVDSEAVKLVVDNIPAGAVLAGNNAYREARAEMQRYMDNVGLHLAGLWNDPRYSRDVFDRFDL